MTRTELSSIMSAAHRMIKIAGISLSEALKISWRNHSLVAKMKRDIVKFYFAKVDGTIREAYGTLSEDKIPAATGTDNRKKNDTVQTFFDTEKRAWRCYKKLNLIRIA